MAERGFLISQIAKNIKYTVRIEWSPCNFGGWRPWFICPVKGCGRRVAILYGDRYFACRHCHKLAYESQRENATCRAIRRSAKLEKRLGLGKDGDARPKGMRRQTFERLLAQRDFYAKISWAGLREEILEQRQCR